MAIRLSRLNWHSQELVGQLLDNKEYFADVENEAIKNGKYDGVSLRSTVEELGTTFYDREFDLEEVEWDKAAEYINSKIDVVPASEAETVWFI